MAKCSLKTSTRRSWLQGTNVKDNIWLLFSFQKKMKLPEAMEKTAHQNWKAAGVESRTSEELSPPSLFWRVSSVQSNPWTVRPPLQIGLAAVKQGPVDSKRGQCFLDSERTDEETDPSNFSGCCTYIGCGKNDSVSINSNGISGLSCRSWMSQKWRAGALVLWMQSQHAVITKMLSICVCSCLSSCLFVSPPSHPRCAWMYCIPWPVTSTALR